MTLDPKYAAAAAAAATTTAGNLSVLHKCRQFRIARVATRRALSPPAHTRHAADEPAAMSAVASDTWVW